MSLRAASAHLLLAALPWACTAPERTPSAGPEGDGARRPALSEESAREAAPESGPGLAPVAAPGTAPPGTPAGPPGAPQESVSARGQERILEIDMLDNGSGTEPVDATAPDGRRFMIPWWVSSGTPRTTTTAAAGLELAPGARLSQPIAAYGPLAVRLRVEGRVVGAGRLRLEDGRGGSFELELRDQSFSFTGADLESRFGRAPEPRFLLELSAPMDSAGAVFHDLRAIVSWPCPEPRDLALELYRLCDGVVRTWLERGSDRDGPRSTAFLTRRFDVVTGEKIDSGAGCIHPLFEGLLEASAFLDVPEWNAALETFLGDFFELGFHPATGLPRDWDGATDLPQDRKPVEVGRYLAFLIDLEETGPERFRGPAARQVDRLVETILARGLLPDGSLAVKYVPADGTPSLDVPLLRRLDVAAQFARLARLRGEERLAECARVALAALEFTHFWAGTWSTIDPDFDDNYGHWGQRAATMLAAFPEDPEFRRFNLGAFAHFAPVWRDALRFGGSMASDQNRCWEFLQRVAQIEPAIRPELDQLMVGSIRAHLKGRQYANGSWGDSTFVAFSPRASLNIGDLTGYPANMLNGLAVACREGSSLRDDATRALFTAVLRSSEQIYRRPHGLILRREQAPGLNVAGGDLRLFAAAVEMLEQLPSDGLRAAR
jgi:hypothetical protein